MRASELISCLKQTVTLTVTGQAMVMGEQDSRTIVRQPGLHSALLSAWCTTQQQAPETISTRVLQEFYKASLAGDLQWLACAFFIWITPKYMLESPDYRRAKGKSERSVHSRRPMVRTSRSFL